MQNNIVVAGRKPLTEMTADDKMDEILQTMRDVSDALAMFQSNPMFSAFMPRG